jgi:hypothetical protein
MIINDVVKSCDAWRKMEYVYRIAVVLLLLVVDQYSNTPWARTLVVYPNHLEYPVSFPSLDNTPKVFNTSHNP